MRRFVRSMVIAWLVLGAASDPAHAGDPLLDYPIEGPKRVCLKYVGFDLKAGERVVDFGAGTETAHLTVEGASSFAVGESEIYRQPRRRGILVHEADGVRIYRIRDGGVRYLIYGHRDFLGKGERYVANISGRTLTGKRMDAEIFSRFGLVDDRRTGCEQSFVYGWDYMFPDIEDAAR